MTKKLIVKFYWDCGRQGEISSTFICDADKLESSYGSDVYFGEVLGKHSEVYGTLDRGDITIVSDDEVFISKFESVMGSYWCEGLNPLDHVE